MKKHLFLGLLLLSGVDVVRADDADDRAQIRLRFKPQYLQGDSGPIARLRYWKIKRALVAAREIEHALVADLLAKQQSRESQGDQYFEITESETVDQADQNFETTIPGIKAVQIAYKIIPRSFCKLAQERTALTRRLQTAFELNPNIFKHRKSRVALAQGLEAMFNRDLLNQFKNLPDPASEKPPAEKKNLMEDVNAKYEEFLKNPTQIDLAAEIKKTFKADDSESVRITPQHLHVSSGPIALLRDWKIKRNSVRKKIPMTTSEFKAHRIAFEIIPYYFDGEGLAVEREHLIRRLQIAFELNPTIFKHRSGRDALAKVLMAMFKLKQLDLKKSVNSRYEEFLKNPTKINLAAEIYVKAADKAAKAERLSKLAEHNESEPRLDTAFAS